jgi:hypothetical protein
VLGYTVVGSVDLANVNPIARRNKRSQQVKYPLPTLSRKEPLDILKDERPRSFPRYDVRKTSHQGVPLVAWPSHPSRRKTLARRATNYNCDFRRVSVHGDGLADDVSAQIYPISSHCGFVVVDGPNDIEPGGAKPQR